VSAPVKLPRRLPDASPRLDLQEPPADPLEREAYWLRRAIRHCERWGLGYPAIASAAGPSRAMVPVVAIDERVLPWAAWLPSRFRFVRLTHARSRLAELEGGAA